MTHKEGAKPKEKKSDIRKEKVTKEKQETARKEKMLERRDHFAQKDKQKNTSDEKGEKGKEKREPAQKDKQKNTSGEKGIETKEKQAGSKEKNPVVKKKKEQIEKKEVTQKEKMSHVKPVEKGKEKIPATKKPDQAKAMDSIFSNTIIKPPRDQNPKEQFGMVKDVAKETVKDLGKEALKNPLKAAKALAEAPEKFAWSLLKKEMPWMGNKLMNDMKDKPMLQNLAHKFVPGLMDGFRQAAGLPSRFSDTDRKNSQLYNIGLQEANNTLSKLQPEARDNFINSMKDPQFQRNLNERLLLTYLERAAQHQ